ncbi:MAG: RNA-binding S4 domain-containing protein [Firmicutes bacterium]|nr:RNA-binding S4 domain-containing protein [Bacillota bacterium]
MQEVYIKTEFIKLNQLLKLAGVLDQGSDIKYMLESCMIRLNGSAVSERGRKIRGNDVVSVTGYEDILVKTDEL